MLVASVAWRLSQVDEPLGDILGLDVLRLDLADADDCVEDRIEPVDGHLEHHPSLTRTDVLGEHVAALHRRCVADSAHGSADVLDDRAGACRCRRSGGPPQRSAPRRGPPRRRRRRCRRRCPLHPCRHRPPQPPRRRSCRGHRPRTRRPSRSRSNRWRCRRRRRSSRRGRGPGRRWRRGSGGGACPSDVPTAAAGSLRGRARPATGRRAGRDDGPARRGSAPRRALAAPPPRWPARSTDEYAMSTSSFGSWRRSRPASISTPSHAAAAVSSGVTDSVSRVEVGGPMRLTSRVSPSIAGCLAARRNAAWTTASTRSKPSPVWIARAKRRCRLDGAEVDHRIEQHLLRRVPVQDRLLGEPQLAGQGVEGRPVDAGRAERAQARQPGSARQCSPMTPSLTRW